MSYWSDDDRRYAPDVIARLKAENAELRELARDMYRQMSDVSETWAEDAFADRLREIGIEVGE